MNIEKLFQKALNRGRFSKWVSNIIFSTICRFWKRDFRQVQGCGSPIDFEHEGIHRECFYKISNMT